MRFYRCAVLVFGAAAVAAAQSTANWDYSGQDGTAELGQTRPRLQSLLAGPRTIANRHSRGPPEQGSAAYRIPLHRRPGHAGKQRPHRSSFTSIPAATSLPMACATSCSSSTSTIPAKKP